MRRRKSNGRIIAGFKKLFLSICAAISIPFIPFLIYEIPVLFSHYTSIDAFMWSSIFGAAAFIIIFFFFGPPLRSYIIAHELTHVIFALITGVKVKEISFKKERSYVKTSDVNVFISLGPYFLPLYSYITFGIYRLIKVFYSIPVGAGLTFYFIGGAAYSYHLAATVYYLRYDQPDLKRYGYFFSIVFLVLWMILVSVMLASLMFPEVQLIAYLKKTLNDYFHFISMLLHINF